MKVKREFGDFVKVDGQALQRLNVGAIKINNQTAFMAMINILAGMEELTELDIQWFDYKLIANALQDRRVCGTSSRGIHLKGASSIATDELTVLNESSENIIELLLSTVDACLDMLPRLIVESLYDHTMKLTWRDAAELSMKHLPASISRKQRWRDVRFETRFILRDFLKSSDLVQCKCPLRITIHMFAAWMRAMLRKLYQPAREFLTAKPSKRDRFDISKFAIFGKINLKLLKDFSDRWKYGWTSLWLRSVKKSKDALTSVGLELEERMIIDEAGTYDLNIDNFSDDDEVSPSLSTKKKKNRNVGDIEPTANALSQRYMKRVRTHVKLKYATIKTPHLYYLQIFSPRLFSRRRL